ncbi:MAG: winged helix-turn-helix transcriptional regulator, partial [Firmicutes bacterium]|nr:winged helix-turn-helix transcriptional regulator [Bacillota bacterium]
EGNTRTTAVFIIKYLRLLGFKNVSNNLFAENSWYFRNALVRAVAVSVVEGIYPNRVYIDRFFGNLLLGEKNILRNRDLHIGAGNNATVNDTVNEENATVNPKNATVNPQNATVNEENATVNDKNATVNDKNATVNPKNATVNDKNATVKVSATQNAILNLLRGNGKLTAEDIANDIGKDIATIKRAIKSLKDKGLLARIGSDKTGYWKVK